MGSCSLHIQRPEDFQSSFQVAKTSRVEKERPIYLVKYTMPSHLLLDISGGQQDGPIVPLASTSYALEHHRHAKPPGSQEKGKNDLSEV